LSFDLKNLAVRVAVALVAIPLVLWTVLEGGTALVALSALLALGGAWEWMRLSGIARIRGLAGIALVWPLVSVVAWYVGGYEGWAFVTVMLLPAVFIATLAADWRDSDVIRMTGATVLGIVYVGMFGLMVPVSMGHGSVSALEGSKLLATTLAMVWLIDTFAYFGGTAFGKHKLAPTVSPNKSWEGAVAGFFGALAGAIVGKWVFEIGSLTTTELLALGAVIGIVAQVGDLAESMVKRDVGVKDSSGIVPGHGGVLDRFDSFLFALPVVWGWLVVRPILQGD
jgi:phosphatidate cytidylyltransferase